MSSLSDFTEEEIWEELQKRNHSVILICLKQYDAKREGVSLSFCGGKFNCLGLIEYAANKVMEEALMGDDLEGEE